MELLFALVCAAASLWLFHSLFKSSGNPAEKGSSWRQQPYVNGTGASQPLTRAERKLPPAAPIRSIVLDTETTGLPVARGHRLVSLAMIEMVDRRPTGRSLLLFFNPGRKCDPIARRIHGLTDLFLSKQPPFCAQANRIVQFIQKSPLIGHNIGFDIGFLNAELFSAGMKGLDNQIICTMLLFAERFPGQRKSLDACCAYFGIDASSRARRHDAFIDANLTSALYQILASGGVAPFQYEMVVHSPQN